ncbi:MAG: hypothetical protein U0166_14205 [Acidobacteriota bacterium]
MTRPARLALCWLLPAVIFLAHARMWSHAVGIGIDDAYIGNRYARNLVESGDFNWNVGKERVEGYTALLWVLLMAIPPLTGIPMPPFFKTVGGVSALGLLALLVLIEEAVQKEEGGSARWPIKSALVASVSANLALYAMSGIETAVFAMLVALGAYFHLRAPARPLASAFAFSLAALTRPEGILLFGLTGLHRVLERSPIRELVLRSVVFASLVVPHHLFRRYYYGLWLPHSFYVKAGGYDRGAQWRAGWAQLRAFYTSQVAPMSGATHWGAGGVLLLAMISALVVHRHWTRAKVYFLLNVSVHALYLCSIGYDFMPKHRHQVMALPFLLGLAAMGIRGWADLASRASPRLGSIACAAATAVVVAGTVDLDTGPIDHHEHANLEPYDVRLEIGLYLAATTPSGAVIATGECGKIPYFARRDVMDLSGINDLAIGKLRPYAEKKPAPLPLDEILRRRPDVVLLPSFQMGLARTRPEDPFKLSPVPTFKDPRFLDAYELREERIRDLYFYSYRLKPGR